MTYIIILDFAVVIWNFRYFHISNYFHGHLEDGVSERNLPSHMKKMITVLRPFYLKTYLNFFGDLKQNCFECLIWIILMKLRFHFLYHEMVSQHLQKFQHPLCLYSSNFVCCFGRLINKILWSLYCCVISNFLNCHF